MMKILYRHRNKGVTLIEALVAAAAVAVLALGGLCYQYLGAAHFRIAHADLTATRTGQLILEDWKASGAPNPENYDATELGIGFETFVGGENFDYIITVDGIKMHLHLSYQDVAVDNGAGITLRQLNVTVRWRRDFGSGTPEADDPSLVMTTYARRGQD